MPELEDVEKDAIATLPRKFKVNVKSHNKIRVGPVSWARCRKKSYTTVGAENLISRQVIPGATGLTLATRRVWWR